MADLGLTMGGLIGGPGGMDPQAGGLKFLLIDLRNVGLRSVYQGFFTKRI